MIITLEQFNKLKEDLKFICEDVWKSYNLIGRVQLHPLQYINKKHNELPEIFTKIQENILNIFNKKLFMKLNIYNVYDESKNFFNYESANELTYSYIYNLNDNYSRIKYHDIIIKDGKMYIINTDGILIELYVNEKLFDLKFIEEYKKCLNESIKMFADFKWLEISYKTEISDFRKFNTLIEKYKCTTQIDYNYIMKINDSKLKVLDNKINKLYKETENYLCK